MDSDIMVETLPMLGTCNLCMNEGAVKSMLVSHYHNGIVENYTEMLLKCFSVNILSLDFGDTKPLVCELCICKLRDTALFKTQVETSLENLEKTVKLNKLSKEESSMVVKQELATDYCEPDFGLADLLDNDGDSTQEPHIEETKIIQKKKRSVKRESSDIPSTKTMLSTGLFPFKISKNRQSFICLICSKKFPNLEDMKTHIDRHTKRHIDMAFNKMMYVDSCEFFRHQTQLRCKICTVDISNYDELVSHSVLESCRRNKYPKMNDWNRLPFKLEKDQLTCPICATTFLNYTNLNNHMNVHYPNYICENCGKAFATKSRLRGHMRTHEEGHFPCRFCDAVFDRATKRENHVSKEHKTGVRYPCRLCNIVLTSFYAKQKHLAEIHNEELKKYKCKACPQRYITPGHLSSHVRRDHLNERNHKCDKCDLAFYSKNALKMHMIKHDGERIHTCNVCQKSYQRKKTLREHMRIHTNDKRFICPVCGRAFTQKCTLKGHLRVHEKKVDSDDRIVDDRIVHLVHSIK